MATMNDTANDGLPTGPQWDRQRLMQIEVGQVLAQLRIERHLARSEASTMMDVSEEYLRQLEAGTLNVTTGNIRKVAEFFGQTLKQVMLEASAAVDDKMARSCPACHTQLMPDGGCPACLAADEYQRPAEAAEGEMELSQQAVIAQRHLNVCFRSAGLSEEDLAATHQALWFIIQDIRKANGAGKIATRKLYLTAIGIYSGCCPAQVLPVLQEFLEFFKQVDHQVQLEKY